MRQEASAADPKRRGADSRASSHASPRVEAR